MTCRSRVLRGRGGAVSDAPGNEACIKCDVYFVARLWTQTAGQQMIGQATAHAPLTGQSDGYRDEGPVGATSSDACACQAGNFSLLADARGAVKCRCPLGQNLLVDGDDPSCQLCDVGSFSDSVGNDPCTEAG